MNTTNSNKARWLALLVLCLGTLMIVLDTTIVNVALPSIKASLGFSDTSLAWVVNAYALTFAGFLLLGGRLGDLYGQRRFFLIGIIVFTLSSIVCGLAGSQFILIAARAAQGIGGAIASAIALSLVMNMFPEPGERAKAMGIFGFVAAGGGSVGAVLGGILTGTLNWHWIFLVNVPIGILVCILSLYLLSGEQADSKNVHLDLVGAFTVTASLMLAVYGIVNGNALGWTSVQTLGTLLGAVILMILFLYIESKVRAPLMPLSLFKLRSVVVANTAGVLWSAAMFSWFFLSALYMQLVLNYDPLQVGLAFVPANLIMAVFSIWLSAKVITRFGIKKSLTTGLALCAAGLLVFAHASEHGTFLTDILLPMILMGFGAGISFNPMLLAAMNDVPEDESGLASGVVNTSFMMGGALGLAILASIASSQTAHLLAAGSSQAAALTGGYDVAFLTGGLFAACGALLVGLGLRI
ncbi:MAG: putative drug resistance transporter, EmrB/QacA subfamily [Candidatus Kaiserbacteria bacterium]|nr:putative drug resistance transporter, EmrB/QacA subfamily [Candidatus Kaiserbacteria bacterium]